MSIIAAVVEVLEHFGKCYQYACTILESSVCHLLSSQILQYDGNLVVDVRGEIPEIICSNVRIAVNCGYSELRDLERSSDRVKCIKLDIIRIIKVC